MKTNFVIIILTIAWGMLSHAAVASLEVRQEIYDFNMMLTQNISCVTFVINESPAPKELLVTCWLSIIPFELGSATLSPAAGSDILADLRKCEVLKNAQLTVTGHTCTLGPEKLNKVLSLQRAEAIAEFLKNHGFTVDTIQGKGSQISISDKITEMYKNRRVEITQNPAHK